MSAAENNNNNNNSAAPGANLKRGGSSSDDESEGDREERGGDVARDLLSLPAAVLVARVLEAEARAREADERAREADERAREADERAREADERAALRSGNYYSSIEQVWADTLQDFNHHAYFDYLRRDKAPGFQSPDGINYYKATLEMAQDPASSVVPEPEPEPDPAPADAAAASTSSPAVSSARKYFKTHRAMWPVDVFGSPYVKGMPLAHLVPHGPDNSTLYFDVVACVLGLKDTKEVRQDGQEVVVPPGWDTVQKAIHGATTGPATAPGKRVDNTGIKHSAPNMIRLYFQAEYLDTDPGLIIVPILTLDEVKAWEGGPYDALALAGEVREEVEGQGIAVTSDFPTVCERIKMTTEGGSEANHEEIETGRKLLTSFVLGMAYSLFRRSPDREQHLTQKQWTKLEGYRRQFPADAKNVLVPAPNPNAPEPLRVRIVKFGSATAGVDGGGDDATAAEGASKAKDKSDKKKLHPAPDPLLLAVRAAINWSRRRGQPLLAAAEPQPDGFEAEYDRRIEQYLESLDRDLRPPDDDPEEFARRLGQLPPDKAATAAAR
jgi:hypothetical protein